MYAHILEEDAGQAEPVRDREMMEGGEMMEGCDVVASTPQVMEPPAHVVDHVQPTTLVSPPMPECSMVCAESALEGPVEEAVHPPVVETSDVKDSQAGPRFLNYTHQILSLYGSFTTFLKCFFHVPRMFTYFHNITIHGIVFLMECWSIMENGFLYIPKVCKQCLELSVFHFEVKIHPYFRVHEMSGMEPPTHRYRTKAPALDRPMTSEPLKPPPGPEGSMTCPPAVVNPLDQLKLVEP